MELRDAKQSKVFRSGLLYAALPIHAGDTPVRAANENGLLAFMTPQEYSLNGIFEMSEDWLAQFNLSHSRKSGPIPAFLLDQGAAASCRCSCTIDVRGHQDAVPS
jgi:hypothetical protein